MWVGFLESAEGVQTGKDWSPLEQEGVLLWTPTVKWCNTYLLFMYWNLVTSVIALGEVVSRLDPEGTALVTESQRAPSCSSKDAR